MAREWNSSLIDGSTAQVLSPLMQQRLTQDQFTAALKRGHGRALLHVQTFGLAEVADLVLGACLNTPVYDRQCESGRARWLFSIFKDSEYYPRFASAILSALRHETDGSELDHLCELAAEMAMNGDEVAADALRSRVLGQTFTPEDFQYGCAALVRVGGLDAVVELARLYGQMPGQHADVDSCPYMRMFIDDPDVRVAAQAKLQQLAETDAAIRAFLSGEQVREDRTNGIIAVSKAEAMERARRDLTLEALLADAAADGKVSRFKYARFGQYATTEELDAVLRRLATSSDEQTCLRLLRVFQRVPSPEPHPVLWKLAQSGQDDVRAAAIRALAQCQDSGVGDFARGALREARSATRVAEGMRTLVKNYQPADQTLIMSALSRISASDDEAHDIGFSVLNICADNDSVDLIAMLNWVYESNPCTLCRESVVRHLIKRDGLPDQYRTECFYDAADDIRQLVRPDAHT